MTAEQARQKKLQKGYVLEPVLQTFSDDSSLPDKRERKKSSHFGNGGCIVCISLVSLSQISAQDIVHLWISCQVLAARLDL